MININTKQNIYKDFVNNDKLFKRIIYRYFYFFIYNMIYDFNFLGGYLNNFKTTTKASELKARFLLLYDIKRADPNYITLLNYYIYTNLMKELRSFNFFNSLFLNKNLIKEKISIMIDFEMTKLDMEQLSTYKNLKTLKNEEIIKRYESNIQDYSINTLNIQEEENSYLNLEMNIDLDTIMTDFILRKIDEYN